MPPFRNPVESSERQAARVSPRARYRQHFHYLHGIAGKNAEVRVIEKQRGRGFMGFGAHEGVAREVVAHARDLFPLGQRQRTSNSTRQHELAVKAQNKPFRRYDRYVLERPIREFDPRSHGQLGRLSEGGNMAWENGAAIAQVVSAIAVLVTLVYLAIQAKQTNNALLAASRQGTMAAEVELLSASFSSVDVASLIVKAPAELTPGEDFAVGAWCAAFVRVREFAWFQYKAGILDESAWRSYVGPTKRLLGLPSLVKWWAQFMQEVDPEFRAYIDSEIRG